MTALRDEAWPAKQVRLGEREKRKRETEERKSKNKKAKTNDGKAPASGSDDDDDDRDESDLSDMSDGDIDINDEEAVEKLMQDIDAGDENDDESGSDADDSDDDNGDASASEEMKEELSAEEKALLDRKVKREKRLKEDEEMEKDPVKRKDIEKQRRYDREHDPRLPRTIFVGNVPARIKSEKVGRWVERELGHETDGQHPSIIESVRLRSVAVADPKLPKKVAAVKRMIHEARDSANAYVVFTEEKPWVDRAVNELNGKEMEFDGNSWRIRVDRADGTSTTTHDTTHTVFCGNLPFSINENELYQHFDGCGPIDHVRIVRDRDSGMGKGIAFITFKDVISMRNALAFNGTKFGERELRVTKAVENKLLHRTKPATSKTDKGKDKTTKGGKAGSASDKKNGSSSSGSSSSRKEGYGGVHKVKVLNNAGVWKKPRHKPRPASAQQVGGSAEARPFEGERANPDSHVIKAKAEERRQKEKKEKKKEKKLLKHKK